MKRLILAGAIACLFALGGCDIYVNTNFARTNQGWVNSNLLQVGTLYYVNLDTNTVSYIETLEFSDKDFVSSKNPSSLETGSMRGLSLAFSGFQVTDADAKTIKAEIGRKASLKLTNFDVRRHRQAFAAIDNRFKSLDEGSIIGWRLQEAVKSKSAIYVLVYGDVRADKTEFYLGDKSDTGSGIEVSYGTAKATLSVTNNSKTNWSGKGTPVLVHLWAWKPYMEGGRYRWKTLSDGELNRMQARLSDALRSGSL